MYDKDTLVYINKSDFDLLDFSKKNSSVHSDQWEQRIVLDSNHVSATIQIRGIDNGIIVDYLFEKVNGAWMLIEIVDKST